MDKQIKIVNGIKNVLINLNDKIFVGYTVYSHGGFKTTQLLTRIVKYNPETNEIFSKNGDDLKKVDRGLCRFLRAEDNDYEIKVKKGVVMFRRNSLEKTPNWRKLTFSIVKG